MRRLGRFIPGLAGAIGLALGGLAGAAAQPPGPAPIKVVVIEGTQLFPMHVMRTKGVAERYQLRIDQTKAAGPQALYTILQTGEFHVAFGAWLTTALLRAQGQKLTNVYSVYRYTNDVMVPVGSSLKTLGDLQGKRVGVFGGPAAATTWLLRLELRKFFGVDLVKESKIHYGAAPLLMGMLEKGDLDAILSLDPQIVQMLETGKFRSIGNLGDLWRSRTGQDPVLVTVTVNERWARQNPDLVKRFVAAFRETLEYLETRSDIWPELAQSVGIKSEQGARLLRERRAFISRWDRQLIEEQYAYAAEVRKLLGDASGVPAQIPEGTFDLSYVQ